MMSRLLEEGLCLTIVSLQFKLKVKETAVREKNIYFQYGFTESSKQNGRWA